MRGRHSVLLAMAKASSLQVSSIDFEQILHCLWPCCCRASPADGSIEQQCCQLELSCLQALPPGKLSTCALITHSWLTLRLLLSCARSVMALRFLSTSTRTGECSVHDCAAFSILLKTQLMSVCCRAFPYTNSPEDQVHGRQEFCSVLCQAAAISKIAAGYRPRQHPAPCRQLPSATLTSTWGCGQTPATLVNTLPPCGQQWVTSCQSSLRNSPRPSRSL